MRHCMVLPNTDEPPGCDFVTQFVVMAEIGNPSTQFLNVPITYNLFSRTEEIIDSGMPVYQFNLAACRDFESAYIDAFTILSVMNVKGGSTAIIQLIHILWGQWAVVDNAVCQVRERFAKLNAASAPGFEVARSCDTKA